MRPFLVAAGLLAAVTAQAAVYRCHSNTGVTFTDRACPGGMQVPDTPASPRSATTAPGLSATEKALLADIERAAQRQAQADAEHRAQSASAQARESARAQARADACARAERELEQLRLIRRKGYKATQARTLELREAKQRAIADASCS